MATPPRPTQQPAPPPTHPPPRAPYESPDPKGAAKDAPAAHALLSPDAAASLFKNGTRIAKDGDPPEKWITMGRLPDGVPVFQTPMTDEIAEQIKAGSFYVVENQGHYSSAPLPPQGATGPQPPATNPPVVKDAPYCGGSGVVGSALTCTMGNWENEPTGYAYQWKADGTDIEGATASAYTPTDEDVGEDVHCTVTATNSAGSASSDSNAVEITTPARQGKK